MMPPGPNSSIRDSAARSGLDDKIFRCTAKVGVVGLCYVGLPTMANAATAQFSPADMDIDPERRGNNVGFKIIGIDIDQDRVDEIFASRRYMEAALDNILANLVQSGQVGTTTDYAVHGKQDIVIIFAPTTIDEHKEPGQAAAALDMGLYAG